MDLSETAQVIIILLILAVLLWLFTLTAVRGVGTHFCAFSGILLPVGWGMKLTGSEGAVPVALMLFGCMALAVTAWKTAHYQHWR